MALEIIAANSIAPLANLIAKSENSRTSYLISEVLKHLSSAANEKIGKQDRQNEAEKAKTQLGDLIKSASVPRESMAFLKDLHADLSTELQDPE
jgi:hypothetical protein